jgi:hypothetical protein
LAKPVAGRNKLHIITASKPDEKKEKDPCCTEEKLYFLPVIPNNVSQPKPTEGFQKGIQSETSQHHGNITISK